MKNEFVQQQCCVVLPLLIHPQANARKYTKFTSNNVHCVFTAFLFLCYLTNMATIKYTYKQTYIITRTISSEKTMS